MTVETQIDAFLRAEWRVERDIALKLAVVFLTSPIWVPCVLAYYTFVYVSHLAGVM